MPPTIVDASDYTEATNDYTGWCVRCKEFTTGCTEPDAEGYECEVCGEESVMGAEQALLLGRIGLAGD